MQQYDSYKDSGVQWLGEIPSHWEIKPGRTIFSENKMKNTALAEEVVLSLSYGKIIEKQNKNDGLVPEEYSSYQIIEPGFIIVRCTDLQNDHVSLRTAISELHGIITSAYLALIPNNSICPKYFHYFFRNWDNTKELYRYGSGLRQSLSWNDFKYLLCVLPPLSEQSSIAAYLDEQTSKIDTAIAQQQKMIDLLNERKQIIINRAVTKGLNPNAKMKDSGVEWIGEINANWEIYRLKNLLASRLMYGANESAESENESYPRYIRITDIDEDGNLKPDTFKSLEPTKAASYLLKKGDVLFARSGATCGKTYLFNEDIKACFAGYLIKATTTSILLPKYLIYYTKSGIYNNWKNSIFIQATIQNIGADKYSNLQIVLPPVEVQHEIVSYLDDKVGEVDKAISNATKQIALLQERKQMIINEVVTGKVKVC